MGKSNEQESDEVIDYRVSAVCLGEGTKSTSEDERQEMQRQVNQPIQATSQDWEIPVVVHAGLVHYQNIVIEQVKTCTHVHVVCLHIIMMLCVYMYIL